MARSIGGPAIAGPTFQLQERFPSAPPPSWSTAWAFAPRQIASEGGLGSGPVPETWWPASDGLGAGLPTLDTGPEDHTLGPRSAYKSGKDRDSGRGGSDWGALSQSTQAGPHGCDQSSVLCESSDEVQGGYSFAPGEFTSTERELINTAMCFINEHLDVVEAAFDAIGFPSGCTTEFIRGSREGWLFGGHQTFTFYKRQSDTDSRWSFLCDNGSERDAHGDPHDASACTDPVARTIGFNPDYLTPFVSRYEGAYSSRLAVIAMAGTLIHELSHLCLTMEDVGHVLSFYWRLHFYCELVDDCLGGWTLPVSNFQTMTEFVRDRLCVDANAGYFAEVGIPLSSACGAKLDWAVSSPGLYSALTYEYPDDARLVCVKNTS